MTDADVSVGAPRRMTRQRAAVAEALNARDDFCSAQELHDALRGQGVSIGLTTVYRALQALSDDGLVDVIARGDGEAAYRLCSSHHHHHLVCRTCRSTVEVEAPQVEAWARATAEAHGFVEVTHTVEIFGTCPRCASH